LQPRLTKSQFEAFGTCLAPELALPDLANLRIWLLSNLDNLARLIEFAAARDLLPALEHCLKRNGLIPPGGGDCGERGVSPAAFLRQVHDDHLKRRADMRSHLVAAVVALNAGGIEPLLLKGCVSLWVDRDPWRQMRDLDVLVQPDQAEGAHDILRRLGFRDAPDAEGQRFGHHLPPLIREGMPGWLELHFRASNSKAEKYLSTPQLWEASVLAPQQGARARILPAPHHVLHGLAHNHFGHRSSSFGTINLKGLQEFAWAVVGMSAAEQESLHVMSSSSARLGAAFELWSAAAASFYHLRLPSGWSVPREVTARASEMLQRTASGAGEPLLATFVRTAGEGLQGSEHSEPEPANVGWPHRLLERFRMVRAAAREIVMPWRDRARLRDKSAGIRR